MLVSRINEFHHHLLEPFVRSGDVVADCTVGNGHDALFLAEAVGGEGHLFGFDVQREAIASARARLLKAGIEESRFTLVADSHERIDEFVPSQIGAAVYNLGYLPGRDRAVATERDTTLRSVEKALKLLRPEGVVSVTLYYGHAGAEDEAGALLEYAAALDCRRVRVLHLHYPNMPNNPPAILLMQRYG